MSSKKQPDRRDGDEIQGGARAAKRDVKLTPPPRVQKVKPEYLSSPSLGDPLAKGTVHKTLAKKPSYGWVTVATFSLLLLVVFGVFFYLPRWVEQSESRVPNQLPAETESVSSESMQVENLQQLAHLKGKAEKAYERVTGLMETLEAMNVSLWGGETYRAAFSAVTSGEAQFVAKDFAGAAEAYRRAEEQLEAVRREARGILRQALENGRRALEAGDAASASGAFRLAAAIAPGRSEAASGLERAGVLNELLALLVSGGELERNGDLQGAVREYRKAVSLDPLSRAAQQALARIDSRFAESAFVETMSEGMAALDRSDYSAAREAFLRAKAMRPEAPEIVDGLAQAEEGLRLQKIAEHRERALALVAKEQWRSAAEAYQAVLELDATIRFARQGKARSLERADLSDRLEFHIKNQQRLSDEKVLEAASQDLDTASTVAPAGPKLQQQIALLEQIIAKAATWVTVHLESDELTEVVIYKVGRLGTFEQHVLELRPGTYTVVGSRSGYRDVRLALVVVAGKEPETLVIRCEERI